MPSPLHRTGCIGGDWRPRSVAMPVSVDGSVPPRRPARDATAAAGPGEHDRAQPVDRRHRRHGGPVALGSTTSRSPSDTGRPIAAELMPSFCSSVRLITSPFHSMVRCTSAISCFTPGKVSKRLCSGGKLPLRGTFPPEVSRRRVVRGAAQIRRQPLGGLRSECIRPASRSPAGATCDWCPPTGPWPHGTGRRRPPPP